MKFYSSIQVICFLSILAIQSVADEPVDFNTDIRPIFAEHCVKCHGADKAEGNLRFDSRQHAFAAADSGASAIVPNDPATSELIKRVSSQDADIQMPPEGERLSSVEIELLSKWISQGAGWNVHWAYQDLEHGPLPHVQNQSWCENEIDRYVLSKLESIDIEPSKPAQRIGLIRRLYLDLLGIPPTIRQIDQFTSDRSPDAYEKLVDQLLGSPHFGERWGRHWLDKARYADSDGYEKDNNRPNAWRYRDWVLNSINSDQPFDQFTAEQLAGDLLPNASTDQILATAFHRQTLTNTEGGTDKEQWRVAAVMDRTETLGTVWLGLSVGCARCHNHKYDSISHKEYYQLFAYFNNGDETATEVPGTKWRQAKYDRERLAFETELKPLQRRLDQLQNEIGKDQTDWEKRLATCAANADQPGESDLPDEIASLLKTEANARTEEQKKQLTNFYTELQKQTQELQATIESKKKNGPKSPTLKARVITERNDKRRTSHILRRGEFKQPLEAVKAATIGALTKTETSKAPANTDSSRLELVHWLVGGKNPIVPRVAVNQIWKNLFGQGLVRTPNDFGIRGEPPTHPQLLDYLAIEYVRLGWSRKAIVRKIVLSATYRQSSVHRLALTDIDPTNRWLSRQNRFRVEAEIIRDMTLSVAGLLSARIGGPSVFPPMPPEAAAVSYANSFKWNDSAGADRYRRGLYTFFKRTAPHPTLTTFDCPDANTTNVKRNRSNTPIGALVLLNNTVYQEAALKLAYRTVAHFDIETGPIIASRLAFAFRICLSRSPTPSETETLTSVFDRAVKYYRSHPEDAKKLVGELQSSFVYFPSIESQIDLNDFNSTTDAVLELAAWTVTTRVILNLDQFVTRE